LETIELPGDGFSQHYIRLRAVYFDDKHEQFSVFADYLYPHDDVKSTIKPAALNEVLQSGMGLHQDDTGMWYLTHWDVRYVPTHPYSDRFQPDGAEHYDRFMSSFTVGFAREGWIDEIEDPDEDEEISI
jgi:hypothetical protein